MQSTDLIRILPEIILMAVGIVVMLLGAFQPHGRGWHVGLSLLGVAGAALAAASQWSKPGFAFGGMLTMDPFSVFFHVLLLVITALVLLFSSDYLEREKLPSAEYCALLLFAATGMGLMVAANELILIFIGLEISSLSSYVLAGFRQGVSSSSESALKYFLLGSFATAFLLYGIALIFGITGTTRLDQVRAALEGRPLSVSVDGPAGNLLVDAATTAAQTVPAPPFPTVLLGLAIALMFVGLAFKVSAAPFQVWTPDVYQGAPAPVAAFLSTGPKAAAFAVFLRVFLGALSNSADLWFWLLWISGALSMLVGNLAALWQSNIKRMLAYSSIAHAGYMMVAFTAHSQEGTTAVLFYLAAYAFMNAGAFLVVTHIAGQGERYVEVDDYAGLGFRAPLLAACLTVFLLSLIGIPLTGGFFGKFYIFRAALHSDLVWLTVLGVLNSAAAAYYYLRVIVAMYMNAPTREVPCERPNPAVRLALLVSVAATFLLGVVPQSVLRLAGTAARWIEQGR